MSFSPNQLRKLRAALRREHIKTRVSDGRTLHYLEGWQVIAQCNRIFGFDSWNREMVSLSCLTARPQGNRFNVSYLARVRVTVKAGDDLVVREGSGVGHAEASTLGQAHEIAAKGAETDATKRALATFGAPFGLMLYGTSADRIVSSNRNSESNSEDTPADSHTGNGYATGQRTAALAEQAPTNPT